MQVPQPSTAAVTSIAEYTTLETGTAAGTPTARTSAVETSTTDHATVEIKTATETLATGTSEDEHVTVEMEAAVPVEAPAVELMVSPAESGSAVVAQTQRPANDDKLNPSAKRQMNILAIIQLVMSILSILFGIVLFAVYRSDVYSSILDWSGHGIWVGVAWLIAGAVGLAAAKDETSSCKIVATMVLNMFAVVFCVIMAGFALAAIFIANGNRDCYRRGYRRAESYSNIHWDCNQESATNTDVALNSLLLIMSLLQFVITIWCSVLCCREVCRCCKTKGTPRVNYNRQPFSTDIFPITQMANTVLYYTYPTTYPTAANQPGVNFQQPYTVYYTAGPGYQQPLQVSLGNNYPPHAGHTGYLQSQSVPSHRAQQESYQTPQTSTTDLPQTSNCEQATGSDQAVVGGHSGRVWLNRPLTTAYSVDQLPVQQ